MDNTEVISSSTGIASTPLQLKKDDVVTTAFVLKTILVLAILLVAVSAILRWLSRRFPSVIPSHNNNSPTNNVRTLAFTKLSLRTKVFLVNIDGHKAVIVETTQGSKLDWLPNAQQNNQELTKED